MTVQVLVMAAGLLVGGNPPQPGATEAKIVAVPVKSGATVSKGDLLFRLGSEPPVAGRIVPIKIEAGQKVEKGQILFRLSELDNK